MDRAAVAAVVLALGAGALLPVSPTAADHHVTVDAALPLDSLEAARRTAPPIAALRGPVTDIAVVGDSVYFDPAPIGWGPENVIVPRIEAMLRRGLTDPRVRVRNLSRPGLAIAFPTDARELGFTTLAEWLDVRLDPTDAPDLVVIPLTSIDLNLNQDRAVEGDLAVGIVAELERVIAGLAARGVRSVVLPAFGINDTMYDARKSVGVPEPVECHANDRVTALNAAAVSAGLPMLLPSFAGLDRDRHGDIAPRYFVDFNPGRVPDDGLHPNRIGHVAIADRIGARLLDALLPGHDGSDP